MKTNLLILAIASSGMLVAQSQEQSIIVDKKETQEFKTAKIVVLDRKEVRPGKKSSTINIDTKEQEPAVIEKKETKTKSEQ